MLPFLDLLLEFEGQTNEDVALLGVKFFRNLQIVAQRRRCGGLLAASHTIKHAPLTHLLGLFPIPVVVVINERVLTITIIHLADEWSQLIRLGPIVLRRLAVKVSDTVHVRGAEFVGAGILVTYDVKGWYSPTHVLNDRNKILPLRVLLKAMHDVNRVLTHDIVAENMVNPLFIVIGGDNFCSLQGE